MVALVLTCRPALHLREPEPTVTPVATEEKKKILNKLGQQMLKLNYRLILSFNVDF